MNGLAVGGVGATARERIDGVVLESVNLDDFLKIRTVNRRHTGPAVGLVNYTEELHGLQLGLVNIAGNNPPWARILPGLNLHF